MLECVISRILLLHESARHTETRGVIIVRAIYATVCKRVVWDINISLHTRSAEYALSHSWMKAGVAHVEGVID